MRDIWEEQLKWIESGEPFVLARVIRTWRSAPRKSGAGMIIGKGMDKESLPKVVGSVSGGCIEGAVIEEALEVLESVESRRISYGVEDDLALSVGLSCGGEVTILLEKHWALSTDPNTKNIWDTLQGCIRNNEPAILISPLPAENVSSGENQSPLLILPEADNAVDFQNNSEEAIALAEGAYKERENRIVEIGGEEFFIQVFPRRDLLLIIGAGHITIPLVRFAKELDFQGVYLLTREHLQPNGKGRLILLTDKIPFPNGIALSPDQKTLYVAESGRNTKIHAFNVKDDGTLDEGRVFFDPSPLKRVGKRGGCDGLKLSLIHI